MKNVELAIKQGLKLELVLYISDSQFFLSLYKNVEVVIGSLKIKHSIFLVKLKDQILF